MMKTITHRLRLLFFILLVGSITGCRSYETAHSGKIAEIKQRGEILIGTTGDYRPLSFLEPETGIYWGFDADLAEIISNRLGVKTRYVATSWPTLTDDMLGKHFDMAMCGITITEARKATMLMSEGYLNNGKTILCRKEEAGRFTSLEAINQPDVVVMVNPGGLNEKFAHENITKARIVVHQKNEEIPSLVAEGKADIMITEVVEAPYYVQNDTRLAAPLLHAPFNSGQIGILMRKDSHDLQKFVNNVIDTCKKDGTLKRLQEKYGLPVAQ